eukprot:2915068-Pyramimonas_sp.AAC.1
MLAQSSHRSPCNSVCKTHAAATVMSVWSWMVHVSGRASPRMLARAAARYSGVTDAAAVAQTAGHFPPGTSLRLGDLGKR